MQVAVEIMMGAIFHIQVGDNATVLDLKIAIHNQENVPADRLILLLDTGNDHIMMNDDQNTLNEYGVQDGSRLQVIFKPLEDEKDDDDDVDTGDDKIMDKDRTESETENERDDNSSDDDNGSSTPKTPNEETTVESPEYISISD